VLDGNHPASSETLAVTNPVNFVEDWDIWVAGTQEVGVERVHVTVIDGSTSSNERLSQDLAAKDPLTFFFWLDTSENIDLNGFEI
jgi:hypothetical protein